MNARLVTLLGGLAVLVALVVVFAGGDSDEPLTAQELGDVEVDRAQPAPQLERPKRPELPEGVTKTHQGVPFEVIEASGSPIYMGKDPVPVYDVLTGEQRSQVRWVARPLRAMNAEKYMPNVAERLKRKSTKAGNFRLPTGSGKDRRKTGRDWYQRDE